MAGDMKKALAMLSRHAGIAQAGKTFKHLLGKSGTNVPASLEEEPEGDMVAKMATPEKALDESAKAWALEQDAAHGYQYDAPAEQPDDAFEPAADEPREMAMPSNGKYMAVITSKSVGLDPRSSRASGIQESAKKRPGRPRKTKY